MADEIRLVTFEGENVAPVNDALMWDVAIGDSGVIYGCETTIKNASTLHIEAGYGVICGRHFQIFESDVPVTLSPGGDLLGRLYIHMDLSDASEPVQLLVETDASLTPEEQDANINIINGVWDMNLATFAVNALTISNLQNVFSTVAGGGAGLIAGTETGATASQAYVAGQYIIWGGRLLEVIAAIAQGDAFVLGTNLSASSTTVGNELTELNSSLTASDNTKFEFCYDSASGKYGYKDGADTFRPFSSGGGQFITGASNGNYDFQIAYMNSDNEYKSYVSTSINDCAAFVGDDSEIGTCEVVWRNSVYNILIKCKKAGWYKKGQYNGVAAPIYQNVGDELTLIPTNAYGCFMAVYLGDDVTIQ